VGVGVGLGVDARMCILDQVASTFLVFKRLHVHVHTFAGKAGRS
jgi:hypothetical protein